MLLSLLPMTRRGALQRNPFTFRASLAGRGGNASAPSTICTARLAVMGNAMVALLTQRVAAPRYGCIAGHMECST
jgi:hypothetical protein